MKIRVLIVEDEPVARRRVKRLLTKHSDIEVVGEASDGLGAVDLVRAVDPDLMLLDIQIPGADAFDVLETLSNGKRQRWPIVVFTTAYGEHALRAFEFEALDYLLKPFSRERFQKMLDRVRKQMHDPQHRDRVPLNAGVQPKGNGRILVKKADEILILRTDEIDWIEAAGDYMKLYVGKETYIIRQTMAKLIATLPQESFVRIQRSITVNIERVKKLHPMFRGEYLVELRDGLRLSSSRRYRANLQAVFDNNL